MNSALDFYRGSAHKLEALKAGAAAPIQKDNIKILPDKGPKLLNEKEGRSSLPKSAASSPKAADLLNKRQYIADIKTPIAAL